ncbi:YajQ family cyclic di-GMP-binding protein [Chengkuizengella axinellae]|uniref:Nucleotide-binding protein Q5Y73_05290 n=1 Tax=Chengkuizengella axinellae TaxID=3064388 RepID=A0ABT9IXI5_9BACL|nr:YajQ family cyclic di-GMP-binding protein [Chengkuizengella sp. 2205SS18-9]MDP5273510.1 YajQ family cyclic di-GMP-binding protein [Chengkuizengella sp. 2205SS18-9]
MASEYSFDIVSKVDLQELSNAIHQAEREIQTRFDFKGSKSEISLNGEEVTVISDDDYKLQSVLDILKTKMVKRNVSVKNLEYGKVEAAASSTVRQNIKVKQGIDQDNSKKIRKMIQDEKLKVKTQVQGEQIRVTGKNKDDLQKVIKMLNEAELTIELQFINMR